jgi:hypothetical protein
MGQNMPDARLLRCLLLTLIPLSSTGATAADDVDSVKHWLPICKALISTTQTDMKGTYLAGECLGMIEAAAFIIQEGQPGGLPFLACLPDNGVSTHELVTTVLGWIERETDLADVNFLVATQIALAATWPCHSVPKPK